MSENPISHAFVIPDRDFLDWYNVLRPYLNAFERVAVVRSPAGNDLNRYRTVTAVQAPLTWFQDNALQHIRHIYPQVVTVDVIRATTPQELVPILKRRIRNNDRYGEKVTNPAHIDTRFVLEWPTAHRPMSLKNTYNDKPAGGDLRESIDIRTERGADVICAASGRVIAIRGTPNEFGYSTFIQVESIVNNERFVTTYERTRNYKVKLWDMVELGQVLAESSSTRLRIMLQHKSPEAVQIFPLKNIVNPRDYIYIQGLRVRPLADGLRVRTLPSLDGKVLGKIYTWDLVETLEHHGRAIEKIGVQDKWLRVRLLNGTEGYAAAWYLTATTQSEGSEVLPGVNPVGVNLDIYHPQGLPNPSNLGGKIGWVRFGYNVSNFVGSEDIVATFNQYLPLMQRYREAGYHIIMTTSHQTYGEGKHEFWPWYSMSDEKWAILIDRFADMMSKIAQQWAGRDLISAWQVWNEQDAPIGVALASVPMYAHNYTRMFARVYQAIRSSDSNVRILTGGFTGGPGNGAAYAQQVVNNLPSNVRPDGIAFHPYGRGVEGSIYAPFGHIDDSIQAYSKVMPTKPLWITEWGILDRPNDSNAAITNYASTFINHLKSRYPGKIATLCWYAWAQGMHNGYGIVDSNGNPRNPLTETFLSL
jgi:hypothetical protein